MKKVELDGPNEGATRAEELLILKELFTNQIDVAVESMRGVHAKNRRAENLASRPHRNIVLIMRSAIT